MIAYDNMLSQEVLSGGGKWSSDPQAELCCFEAGHVGHAT